MNRQQIEAWALRAVEVVEAGGRIEDDRVECKSVWLEPAKAARRIAACANTARGGDVLWIVGIDEKAHDVVGAGDSDLIDWWPAVVKHFDEGIAPDLQHVVVPVGSGLAVVALAFTTDRAPYVITKGSEDKGFDREIPWRQGTHTRSAHRREVMRLLLPTVEKPPIEFVAGELIASRNDLDERHRLMFVLSMKFFVGMPQASTTLAAHELTAAIRVQGLSPIPMAASFGEAGNLLASSFGVGTSGYDLAITGPGRFGVRATWMTTDLREEFWAERQAIVGMVGFGFVGSDQRTIVTARLEAAIAEKPDHVFRLWSGRRATPTDEWPPHLP